MPSKGLVEGPKRRADRANSQDAILRAAAQIFSANGYDAGTTREIARAAGLSKAGFYHHVPAKQDLLYQIMDQHVARFLQATRHTYSLDLPPDQKMALFLMECCAGILRLARGHYKRLPRMLAKSSSRKSSRR